MEVDEIHQTQGCKFSRIGGRGGDCNNEIGQKGEDQYPDDEEDGELRMSGGGNGIGVGSARFCGWPSSRIVRVSRASGGKDRHSKVLTSKGLRDRRVRLSVTTAIQFYDLQDRLGCDQPSKAVEWLLKAAAKSIDELPCINTSFPDTPKQLSDEKRSIGEGVEHGFDSAEVELDVDNNYLHQQQQQHVSLSKSACSSNSETSKGSSLSRSERHIKARERAKERRAGKEKERETESRITNPQNVNPISRSSFTELLTGGLNNVNNSSSNGETNLVQKSSRQWSSATPMDYFSSGLLALSSSSSPRNHHPSGFQLGNSLPPQSMFSTVSGDHHHHHHHHHHQEMQHFSFNPNPDHHHHQLIPVMNAAGSGGGSEYNLNFTISSSTSPSLAGFNRGTLQSNSPSLLPHLQRLSPTTIDGSNSNLPFFIGTAASNAAPVENHNHHHYPDGGLQLCYGGDGGNRHSDQKGKGKN